MITLIDYGSGNIHAIANIYKSLNIPYCITHDVQELKAAEKLIMPGVGDFDETMTCLNNLGIKGVLDEFACRRKRLK